MDVNVASIATCRAVVPVMQANGGGKIVNISSGTPFRGVPFLLHYVTSKGAIVAFARALAKEVGRDGVLVNCVAPGFTMSAGVEEHPEVIDALREVSVASRTIQRDQVPEDVVGAVVYLAGASSAFVTGQTIVIDGGRCFPLSNAWSGTLSLFACSDGLRSEAGERIVYDVAGEQGLVRSRRRRGSRAGLEAGARREAAEGSLLSHPVSLDASQPWIARCGPHRRRGVMLRSAVVPEGDGVHAQRKRH